MRIDGWNKKQGVSADCYKQYNIRERESGRVCVKDYGLLELTHEGEEWAVWIPPYEINDIRLLTGVSVTEVPSFWQEAFAMD